MKRLDIIAFITLALFAASNASAQQRTYIKTLGDKQISTITMSESRNGDKIIARVTEGRRVEIHTMDAGRTTIAFQVIDPDKRTDATVTLNSGIYTIKGKLNGKAIDRTEKGSGNPWYQNPEINGVHLFKGKQNLKYEAIRPDNLDLSTLKNTDKGTQTIDGMEVTQLLTTNTGPFAGVWTCSYCFDPKTGVFVLYKSVEGAPGTSETKIRIKK